MEAKYRFTLSEDALGIVVELHGPGMPRYANRVHLLQPTNEWAQKVLTEDGKHWASDAERIVGLLEDAFAAGKLARSRELRALLGVP
jgi:hypothetical protein